MKLYATTTSERATKGQGGNNYISIILNDENKNPLITLRAENINGKSCNITIVRWDEEKVILDGNFLYKGERQKGDKCDCVKCTNARGETNIPF